MWLDHFLLTLAWVAYGALHSILAGAGVKRVAAKLMGRGFRYYRLCYSLLALVLAAGIIAWQLRMPSPLLWTPSWFTRVPGTVLMATGMYGMFVCLKNYFSSPAGLRDLFLEGLTPPLQKEGLHRVVRHPLYAFTFLFIWGIFLDHPLLSLFLMNAVITVYTLVAIRFEEKKLVLLYGNAYRQYQSEVPMIIPRRKKQSGRSG